MLNMVCFQVIGNDTTVALASGAGQLELNVMMPVIIHNLLESMALLTAALDAFTSKCLRGLRADEARCRAHFERSTAIATALSPILGYARTAELVQEALRTGESVLEQARATGAVAPSLLDRLADGRRLTRPGLLRGAGPGLRDPRGAGRSGRGRRG